MNDDSRRRQLHLMPPDAMPDSTEPSPLAVHYAFDPARLTQARYLAGMTKKTVADLIGVSAAAVGQYELGVTRPRPEVLPRIAEVLDVPLAFFIAGRPHGRLDTSGAHFRSLRKTSSSQRNKATASAEQIWELAHALERHVYLPDINLPSPRLSDDDAEDTPDQPADPLGSARSLRRHWHLGDGPVQHLVRRIETNGIIVVTPPRDSGLQSVDAFSTSQFSRPIIVLTPNRADDVYRHRFTAAHELGHLVMHSTATGDPAQEREADMFAAEFLTPRNSILPGLPRRVDLRHLAELSRVWGVSVHSLLYRCRETGLLSDTAASRGYQRLRTLQGQPGFAPQSILSFPTEQPSMLRQAFNVASQSGLTIQSLGAELGWRPSKCETLLGMPAVKPTLELVVD
ncbi:XRE family transcriptional regulator [Pseudonocardia eucalypti]|uniref:XRE family transcriptional regulator n=1 Tax=Pseudonocardia eucalypti TaxID=648755 RepID=A0ABP9Q280_9PSEU|nr:Zn-dependent peptidase ImmA (M78 family)/DNA-binding XRE family transcriptional regulator [Pseudonocardia eucalypti]